MVYLEIGRGLGANSELIVSLETLEAFLLLPNIGIRYSKKKLNK